MWDGWYHILYIKKSTQWPAVAFLANLNSVLFPWGCSSFFLLSPSPSSFCSSSANNFHHSTWIKSDQIIFPFPPPRSVPIIIIIFPISSSPPLFLPLRNSSIHSFFLFFLSTVYVTLFSFALLFLLLYSPEVTINQDEEQFGGDGWSTTPPASNCLNRMNEGGGMVRSWSTPTSPLAPPILKFANLRNVCSRSCLFCPPTPSLSFSYLSPPSSTKELV